MNKKTGYVTWIGKVLTVLIFIFLHNVLIYVSKYGMFWFIRCAWYSVEGFSGNARETLRDIQHSGTFTHRGFADFLPHLFFYREDLHV